MTEQSPPDAPFEFVYPEALDDDQSLILDAGDAVELTFQIENRSNFPMRAQIRRRVSQARMADWFDSQPIQERDVPIGGTIDYAVTVRPPAETRSGDYAFRLEVLDLALPDDTLTRSAPLTLHVVEQDAQPLPRWLLIAGAAVLVLLAGFLVALVVLSNLPQGGDEHIVYTRNEPPTYLYHRLPVPDRNTNIDTSVRNRFTTSTLYEPFLNGQAQLTGYAEYDPAWSSDGCELVYGASLTVDNYLLNPNQTLYDLRSLLGVSAQEMAGIAGQVLDYEPLQTFLTENPGYADAAQNSAFNPYLELVNDDATALVSYYQRTLQRLSPRFAGQFYRHVASVVYANIDRSTLYGLFRMDLRQSPPSLELLTWARLDGDTRYLPANPAWQRTGEGDATADWIAFEYAEDIARTDTSSYLALYRADDSASASTLYLLRSQELQADDGLFYDRDPAWWMSADGTQGLYFVSRHDLNYDDLRQAQLYRLRLDFEALANSSSRINATPVPDVEDVAYADIVSPTPTQTLTPTPVPEGTVTTSTPIPPPQPVPTLYRLPLQYTPVLTPEPTVTTTATPARAAPAVVTQVFNVPFGRVPGTFGVPGSRRITVPREAVMRDVQIEGEFVPALVVTNTPLPRPTLSAPLDVSNSDLQNVSSNSVNDSAPAAIDADTLIFISDRDGAAPRESQHLFRLDIADITNPVVERLTDAERTTLEYAPALSPDGNEIIFVRQIGRAPQLYTLELGESTTERITGENTQLETDPVWQPQACADAVFPQQETQP